MSLLTDWLSVLESSAPATALRGSVWVYPMVNAGHICGVALLIGAIIPLDLRLLGWWSTIPLAPLWRVLTRTAAVGLGMAVICGLIMFAARATDYANSSLFVGKMAVVAVGVLNALVAHLGLPRRGPGNRADPQQPSPRLRAAAGVSIAAWIGALILGRLVGYF